MVQTTHAQLDLKASGVLIEKLEMATSQLEKPLEQKTSLILRLADLYADRARQRFVLEVEKDCNNCLNSADDRQKSLKHYQSIFQFLSGSDQGQVLVQMAHLHLALNQKKAAQTALTKATNLAKHPHSVAAEAHAGLGEIAFQSGKFKEAKTEFEKALNLADTAQRSRGLWMYRIAWSALNLGQTQIAISTIERLLSNSQLMGSQPPQYSSFHEDISRDYATFLAKNKITSQTLKRLMQASPPAALKGNLYFFASEAERLSHPEGALLVLDAYSKLDNLSDEDRQEVALRRAQMHKDLKQFRQALNLYTEAINLIKSKTCTAESTVCEDLLKRTKNFVLNWNNQEKKNPSISLLKAYQTSLILFEKDPEMHYWAAQVARHLSQAKIAFRMYYQASVLLAQINKEERSKQKLQSVFEGALLAQIEMAEETKDPQLRSTAYQHYLKTNPQGAKAFEVRYQQVHLKYEKRNFLEAAEGFRELVLEISTDSGTRPFQIKAADLALDALAAINRDDLIEIWSEEFALKLQERKTEYLALQQKAKLNLVAQSLNQKQLSSAETIQLRAKLPKVLSQNSSVQERISYWKSQLILSEKLKDLSNVNRAAMELEQITPHSSANHRLALRSRQWVAEMQLNFPTAYTLFDQVENPQKKPSILLKKAILAELSQRPSEHLYRKFIKATSSRRQANEVRAKLIRESKDPWKGIMDEFSALSRTPDILSRLALRAWAKKADSRAAQKVLKTKGVRSTQEGLALFRQSFYLNFDRSSQSIARDRMKKTQDKALQKSIGSRIKKLESLTVYANEAIRSKDPILQILTLATVSRENRRFYHELVSLNTPRGLSAKDQKTYRQTLEVQASQFLNESQMVEQKLATFWSSSEIFDALKQAHSQSDPLSRKIFASELEMLASLAPTQISRDLTQAARVQKVNPTRKQILGARAALSKDPFNQEKLERLKALEEQAGGETMVTYLESRLLTMNERGS